MADVILIQPRTELLDALKSNPTLPLSLLAAVRRVVREFEVRLIDQRVDREWRATLMAELARKPLCVALTSVTGRQLRAALEAVREVGASSSVPVVWGGIHATLLAETTAREAGVGFVIRGEGEETFLELVRAIADKGDPRQVAGLAFMKGRDGGRQERTYQDRIDGEGEIVTNPERPFLKMDDLEEIPYHLVGDRYLFLRGGRPTLYVETSRGCPLPCSYCYNLAFHRRRWRAMSPERVLHHITHALETFPALKHLSIVDDNYFTDPRRVRAIAERLVELDSDLTYQVQGATVESITRLEDDDLRLLRRSGCVRLDMGVESGSSACLGTVRKHIDFEKLLELNRRLLAHQIVPWYNFMTGFPGESETDIDATIDLIFALLEDNPEALISPIYNLAPYPGTEVFEKAVAAGLTPRARPPAGPTSAWITHTCPGQPRACCAGPPPSTSSPSSSTTRWASTRRGAGSPASPASTARWRGCASGDASSTCSWKNGWPSVSRPYCQRASLVQDRDPC